MFRRLSTPQLVVDVAIALLFLLSTAFIDPRPGTGGFVAGVLVAVGMSGALAVRRLSPPLALLIAWVTAVGQMATGQPPLASNLAIFAVLYTTAAYGSRVVFWAGFVSSFVGATAIAVYVVFVATFMYGGGFDPSQLPIAVLVLIAAVFALGLAWTAGALVRTARRATQTRVARDAAMAEAVAEAERVRIARDMHDVVAHSLAVVIAQADGARYAAAADPDAATAALATISTTARSALSDVRLLLTQLRHQQGDGPQPTLADLDTLFSQFHAAGVDLRVAIAPVPPEDVPASIQLAVFRILQEALTNALRHGAGPVEVWLAWHPGEVRVTVRNALRAPVAPGNAGHGVVGMQERAMLVGGRLHAAPVDQSFLVDATLPLGGLV